MKEKSVSRFFAWWQFLCPAVIFILSTIGVIGQIYTGVFNIFSGIIFVAAASVSGVCGYSALQELRGEYTNKVDEK